MRFHLDDILIFFLCLGIPSYLAVYLKLISCLNYAQNEGGISFDQSCFTALMVSLSLSITGGLSGVILGARCFETLPCSDVLKPSLVVLLFTEGEFHCLEQINMLKYRIARLKIYRHINKEKIPLCFLPESNVGNLLK